jgi:HPt (histidine-containing phosphotransfer) domain-containing protein
MSNTSSLPLVDADAAVAVPDDRVSMLDAAALGRLRDLDPSGDNRVMERVMRAFESSLSKLLAQAEAAQAMHDHAAIRHVAHTLKSSSASVGALELSRRCAEIEVHLREHPQDDLAPHVRGLRAEGRRVLVAVQALLNP